MSVVQFEDVVEGCLRRLEEGEDVETILASYPDQALELTPMLEVMAETRRLASEISVPAAAQNRSRAQFLTAAAGMQAAPRKPRFTLYHLRLATSAMIAIGILAAILLGTGLASAAALPGDVFYPVKLLVEQMQINIAQDPPARLELQETYDNRRMQEAEQLSQMNRRQPVTFGGFLTQTTPGHWQVGSVTLAFPADFALPTNLVGTYVQVSGISTNQMVEVEVIEARQLQWSGTLEKFDDDTWLVGGVSLAVNGETHMTGGKPQVGTQVQVTAVRESENLFLALDLIVNGEPTIERGPLLISSQTPAPVEVAPGDPEVSEPARTAPPAVQPPQPSFTPLPPSGGDPPDGKVTPVTQTAASGDGEKQDGERKSTPVPSGQVTVDGANQPTPTRGEEDNHPSATPQKDATRTPTPHDD